MKHGGLGHHKAGHGCVFLQRTPNCGPFGSPFKPRKKDKILPHFDTMMGNYHLLAFIGGMIIPGPLRWRRILTLHSTWLAVLVAEDLELQGLPDQRVPQGGQVCCQRLASRRAFLVGESEAK